MISEERVLELYDRANPVPNVDELGGSLGAAGYLATLERRSSEVTQLDVKTDEKQKRNPLVWAVAVVAVIVLGAVLVFATRGNEGPVVTEPTPTTIADAAPTTAADQSPTTVVEEPTTTLDAAERAWQEQPLWVTGGTGEFRTNTFAVPFAFSTDNQRWSNDTQTESWISIYNEETPSVGVDVLLGLDSVEATVQAWRDTHEALSDATMTEPEPVTLAGANGMVFETTGLPINTNLQPEFAVIEFARTDGFVAGGEDGVVYVVDVDGQTVIVALTAATAIYDVAFTPDPELFPQAVESAEAVINSIVWKDLG